MNADRSKLWRLLGRCGHPAAPKPARLLYSFYQAGFKVGHRIVVGHDRVPVYEDDWDVLVILDGCRVDVFDSVATEFEFVEAGTSTTSVGSSSLEWMEETFTEEYADDVAETAYVTGNVKSHVALDPEDFAVVDEVWKYAWDEDLGTIPPRPITDRALRIWGDRDPERMIVHYMQPHFPSLVAPDLGSGTLRDLDGGEWRDDSVWNRLRSGDVAAETVWDAYRGNLLAVLEDVELLLESIDADDVVISSDHGNAFGEFGFYDHPGYHPLSVLREVPWYETSANDTSNYEPSTERQSIDVSDEGVERRLESLGYVTS
jgi:hypothetical protein